MSFKFTARLLKTALSNVTLGRPVVFDAQAEGKITGQTKHHTNGDLPMSVVRDSLTRSVDLVAHAGGQRMNILSVGKAVEGMVDGQGRPRPVGSNVFIQVAVYVKKKSFLCLTAYPLRDLAEFRKIKGFGLSQIAYDQLLRNATL